MTESKNERTQPGYIPFLGKEAGIHDEKVWEEARAFATKANLCTHSGVYSLALPVFAELHKLRKAMGEK